MCHESWTRRRDERFEEELRYLLDERERPEPPAPVMEHEPEAEPPKEAPSRVEAASRA